MLIQTVSSEITAKQAGELYGLKFDRRGIKAVCPWHNDHTPSLSFKGSRCKCFACNNGGDAVDLTAQIFGISTMDAAKKLQNDFGIGVEVDNTSVAELRAKQRERDREKEYRRKRYIRLCNIERNSREALKAYAPETAWNNRKFLELLKAFARAQDELNGWET